MNAPVSHIESQEKDFTTFYDLLLEDDGIAIVTLFVLTINSYKDFSKIGYFSSCIVPVARTVPRKKILAAYEQFQQEGYIPEEFRSRLELFISRIREIQGMKKEHRNILLKDLEVEIGNFIFWENGGTYDRKTLAGYGKGKEIPRLEIKNGEISFLVDSHNVQGNITAAFEDVMSIEEE